MDEIKKQSEIDFEKRWPKYLAGAAVLVAAVCLLNLPFVRHLHFNSNLKDEKDRIMARFYKQLDREEQRFQQNLLKKFRKEKNMEVVNVTEED